MSLKMLNALGKMGFWVQTGQAGATYQVHAQRPRHRQRLGTAAIGQPAAILPPRPVLGMMQFVFDASVAPDHCHQPPEQGPMRLQACRVKMHVGLAFALIGARGQITQISG
jgi:hypothetical protein